MSNFIYENTLWISFAFLFAIMIICFVSCTISFQNIDTHGPASDLVDDTQAASPDITADIPLVKP